MADEGNIHYLNPKNKTLEDTLLEIANVIKDDPNSNSSLQPQSNINNIHGNNNIVGNGNTVVTFNNPVTRNTKKVEVKTGDGVLDASEKAQVQNLVRQWVSDNNAVKINKKLTMAMAWSILNKKMKVNSYHEIKSEAFDQAIKWLRSQIGMINGMKSAPKKISDWRPGRIKAIQARCSERGWQDWRKDYMQKKFNKSSMKELTDVELEQLYKTVFGKK